LCPRRGFEGRPYGGPDVHGNPSGSPGLPAG